MSEWIDLDLKVPLDRFTLQLSWRTWEESLGIFGHSGAGKTTVLESLAGLRPSATGVIRVKGETWLDSARGVCLPTERRGVGYVPQDTLLFPHRTVLGNLLAGTRRPGKTRMVHPALEKVIEVLELAPLRDARVTELSGGEKQRVALGRALCSAPKLLLMDEPLAGLDLPMRRRILPFLVRAREEFGFPTIFVSHDAAEMKILSREVLVLAEGRSLGVGPPEQVFFEPSVVPLLEEEGFVNVLEGKVSESRESGLLVEMEPDLCVLIPLGDLQGAQEVIFSLPAEDTLLSLSRPVGLSAQNVLAGTVHEIRGDADRTGRDGAVLVAVKVGHGERRLMASITRQSLQRLALKQGTEVYLVFKAQSCRILAAR